jgi:hypothetical protein
MSFPEHYTRRDKEVILDVLVRLYTARIPLEKPRTEDTDHDLLLRCTEDAIGVAVSVLGLERPTTIPKTTQH